MAEPVRIDGFVVVYADAPPTGGTFAETPGGAWARLMPGTGNPGEDAQRRQRAMDKGYRLLRATLTISSEHPHGR